MQPAIYFEYENLSDTIMQFGMNCNLKIIVALGGKNQNGTKRPAIEQYRYPSNKYLDMDHLVSMKRSFRVYLMIDYPNQDNNSVLKMKSIMLPSYSIIGLLDKMEEFDKNIQKAYTYKRNKLVMIYNDIHVISNPTKYGSLELIPDIYYPDKNSDEKEIGVKMIINNEFEIIYSYYRTWKSFLYYIKTCDLYGWGSTMLSGLTTRMVGNVTEIGGDIPLEYDKNVSTPENTQNTTIRRIKPLNNDDKKKNFFDD